MIKWFGENLLSIIDHFFAFLTGTSATTRETIPILSTGVTGTIAERVR